MEISIESGATFSEDFKIAPCNFVHVQTLTLHGHARVPYSLAVFANINFYQAM
jgi:hypothetical protein